MGQTATAVETTYASETPSSREQFERDRKSMPGGAKGGVFLRTLSDHDAAGRGLLPI